MSELALRMALSEAVGCMVRSMMSDDACDQSYNEDMSHAIYSGYLALGDEQAARKWFNPDAPNPDWMQRVLDKALREAARLAPTESVEDASASPLGGQDG